VLARRAIRILPPRISLAAADEAVAGSVVSVTGTGQLSNDYLTIVAAAVTDGGRGAIAYTLKGSPVQVTVPGEAGACEIRYMSGWGDKVLARRAIKTVAADVTLAAPDEGVAGSNVPVTWSGPNNENDYITIVERSVPTAVARALPGLSAGRRFRLLRLANPVTARSVMSAATTTRCSPGGPSRLSRARSL